MDYNTKRDKLIMPEYGRGIQQMVEHCKTIADKDERMRCAQTIINTMANMAEQTADREDFQKKLWNHLAAMAQYDLDIDYPVNIVPQEEVQAHPAPLPYPMKAIKRRHYGYLVEQALDYAKTLEDEEMRQFITESVANQMKQDLFIWNRDSMDNALVAQDIDRYSNGELNLDLDHFTFEAVGESPLQPSEGGKKRKRRK